jgi:WD40 repeat protein
MLVHHLKHGRVESLAFGPDGRALVVPRRTNGLFIWDDVTAGGPPRTLPHDVDTPHGRVRFSADGRRVGCRGWFRWVVFDMTGGDPVEFEPELAHSTYFAALTPDGDAVVLSQSVPRLDQMTGRFDARLSLRPLADPQLTADRWTLNTHRWVWGEVAFLPGGVEFVSPELVPVDRRPWNEPRWVVRDLATGRELRSSPPLGRHPGQLTASPDGRWVAGVHTKHLVAWQPDDPDTPPVVRLNAGRLYFTGLAFHPSGAYLATTSTDATVRVYNTASWEVARTLDWQVGKLRCIDFSPDGLLAAVGSDTGKVVIWDVDL